MIPSAAKGYSLIEMLVAMSIFAVVSGLTISNYGSGRRSDELRYAGQILDTSIRRAQTNSLAGTTVGYCDATADDSRTRLCPNGLSDCREGETCVTDVPNAWGIHLTYAASGARSIVLFADVNGDFRYDPFEAVRSNSISPGKSVVVSGLSPAVNQALDITFMPPKPTVRFNGLPSAPGEAVPGLPLLASVVLTNPIDGTFRRVTVNRLSGQVSNE